MDLKNTQLKDTFGNLLTIDTSAGTPTTGTIQNGNGDDITSLDIRTATNKNLNIKALPAFDNFSNQGVGISLSRTSSDADLMALGVVDTDKLGLFSRSGIILATGGSNAFQHTSEVIRIDGSGNLGLGISSPDYKAHIFDDTITSSTKTLLQFDSNSIADGGGYNIDFRTSSNDTADRFVARIQGAREGSGATSQLSFFTDDGSSLNRRMLINASGNVGIGTDSPETKLHLVDTSNPANTSGSIIIEGRRDGTANLLTLRAKDASAPTSALPNGQGSVLRWQGFDGTDFENMGYILVSADGQAVANGDAPSFMAFGTSADGSSSPTERMRIDSSGNVGIGTTSNSTFALEVVGDSTDGVLAVKNGANDRNTFRSSNSGGTRTLDIGNNSSGHGILNIRNSSGSVQAQIQGSGDSFFTGGDVLIGKTSSGIAVEGVEFDTSSHFTNFTRNRDSAGGTLIQLNRTGIFASGSLMSFMRAGTEVGSISTTSTATAYNTSSDYRLKENIKPLSSALDTISKIKPSTFNFIDTPDESVDGFIAHELAEVVSYAVSGEKDGIDENGEPIYQGVDHSKLVPLLVGAIKELKAEIEQLKNK